MTFSRPSDRPVSVLFLSPFFFPEPISTGKYNAFLANALVSAGCDLEVIASHPFYPAWQPMFSDAEMPGVKTVRGGLWMKYPASAVVRRLFLEIWFSLHVARQLLFRRRNFDVLVAVFPPVAFTFLACLILSKRIRRVGIVHDLQGIMAKSRQGFARRIVARIIQLVEGQAFRRFDLLVCLSRSMLAELERSYGLDSEKCRVHYPFTTMRETTDGVRIGEEVMPEGFRHVVYSGALGEKQRPQELLAFFRALVTARSDVMCHIFSEGPVFSQLRTEIGIECADRLRFHSLVPEDHLWDLYRRSSIQVIPQAEGTGAGAFPSKLPNLLAMFVPVLAICDAESELAQVLSESEGGISVAGGSLADALEAADALLANEDKQNYNGKCAAFVHRNFDVNSIVCSILAES